MKLKSMMCVLAMSMGAMSTVCHADGIPVANLQEAIQLQQQIQNGLDQIANLKQQISAVTGAYQRGVQGLQDAVSAAKSLPSTWQDVVAQQAQGAYSSAQAAVEKVIQTANPSTFVNSLTGATYKMATDSARTALAGSQTLYDEAQTHLNNFVQLAQQVDTTVNVKDAADLQNRMTAELGMAQAAQTKLQAFAANLQANQLNESNQATAARMKFFGQTQ
ncbi:type IV secretion system protein [Burkholderia stagnalis]